MKNKLTERQRFEIWMIAAYPEIILDRQPTTGYYLDNMATMAWGTWRESAKEKR